MTPDEGLRCQQIVNLLLCIEMRESRVGTLSFANSILHAHLPACGLTAILNVIYIARVRMNLVGKCGAGCRLIRMQAGVFIEADHGENLLKMWRQAIALHRAIGFIGSHQQFNNQRNSA